LCKFKERVNFEATFNDYVDVDCDVIAAEYPTDAEMIQTIERGADIDCEVLEDDIGEDDCSEKLPSVGVRDAISALECKIVHSSTRKYQ
jgi:ribonuclease PH